MRGGKPMKKNWTDQHLDQMREVADPLADKVVADVINSGGLETFNDMLRKLVNDRNAIPEALPKVVVEYFENTQSLPPWADKDKIVKGELVFDLYGPEMITMLFFR